MTKQNIELTKDPLTNIHIMAPLLDETGRASAFGFLYGLILGERNNAGDDKKDRDGGPRKAG